MANDSFVTARGTILIAEMEGILKRINDRIFEGRFAVTRDEVIEAQDRTLKAFWKVTVPGSAPTKSSFYWAAGEDRGFSVALQRNCAVVQFRHPRAPWEAWAQNVFLFEVATSLGGTITPDITKGVDVTKAGRTYWQYATKGWPDEKPEQDPDFMSEFETFVPEGFRERA